MSEKDLDGLKKNLHEMKMAERRLDKNLRVIESRTLYKQSGWFKKGKMNKAHRYQDLHTEEARAEPYYYAHKMLLYRFLPAVLLNVAQAGLLAFLLLW